MLLSGISGRVTGHLLRGRAGAKRRAANAGKQGDLLINRLAQSLRIKSESKEAAKRRQLDCSKIMRMQSRNASNSDFCGLSTCS